MQPEVKTYNVHIAGQPLRLKATHDQETVNQIVQMVETQMTNSSKTASSKSNASVLACLLLAEELFLYKQKAKEELDTIETLANDHLSQLQFFE